MVQDDARATIGHPAPLNNTVTRPAIDDAIRLLAPSGKYADIEALFEHRAPYSCIREWRRGRVGTPQWARDLLASKLQAQADKLAHGARRTAAIIPGPGRAAAAPNLMAWHARNKEKAGNKPALPE